MIKSGVEVALVGMSAVLAGTGAVALFGLPEPAVILIAGLCGSGMMAWARFHSDTQAHPFSEWAGALLTGVVAAYLLAPGVIVVFGLQEIATQVTTITAGLTQLLIENIIRLDRAGVVENILKSFAALLVRMSGGGKG